LLSLEDVEDQGIFRHTDNRVQSRFVPPDRVRRSSPHIDRFRKSAAADFRHFGRRCIVEGDEPCRNHQSSRRQDPRAGPRAELPFAEAPRPRRLRLHSRLASLARYAATTLPLNSECTRAHAPPLMGAARVHKNRRR
jgi:hypothetical protein